MRGKRASTFLEEKRRAFPKSLKKRIRYYRQFIEYPENHPLDVVGAYRHTSNDGNAEFYSKTLWEENKLRKNCDASSGRRRRRSDNEDELECMVRKLENIGFKIFRRGEEERDWLDYKKM